MKLNVSIKNNETTKVRSLNNRKKLHLTLLIPDRIDVICIRFYLHNWWLHVVRGWTYQDYLVLAVDSFNKANLETKAETIFYLFYWELTESQERGWWVFIIYPLIIHMMPQNNIAIRDAESTELCSKQLSIFIHHTHSRWWHFESHD